MERARAGQEDPSGGARENERLLELSRRLRALVGELRRYTIEGEQNAAPGTPAPPAGGDALMPDGHAGEALSRDGGVDTEAPQAVHSAAQ